MKTTNELFRVCLSAVDEETRAQFNLSFCIAERLAAILKEKDMTQHEFAKIMGKRDSEISKWLTGRHNFTISTIASIELALGEKLIGITE